MELSDKEYGKILDKVPYTLPDEEVPETLEVPQTITTPVEKNPIEMIKKLAELKGAGILTEEEFESKKAELLSRI
ncbi:MAG: SHOCT domain-containing protein [Negativicutes bacterium]|mgnify:FL=1|jgi:hypothetical protein|nr:SHOCT domain-containing protein [Negativicutes bacterium]